MVVKSLSQGFYRAFLGPKGGSIEPFEGSHYFAWRTFRKDFFSSVSGAGEREEESEGRGGYFYLEIRGGGFPRRGGGVAHTQACRVSWGEGGGGGG